jgi:hypothetical protein
MEINLTIGQILDAIKSLLSPISRREQEIEIELTERQYELLKIKVLAEDRAQGFRR